MMLGSEKKKRTKRARIAKIPLQFQYGSESHGSSMSKLNERHCTPIYSEHKESKKEKKEEKSKKKRKTQQTTNSKIILEAI